MQKQGKTISFKGQSIFIGIDVHLKSWTVAVLVGEVMNKSFSQDPSVENLKNYLDKKFPRWRLFFGL